MKKINVCVVGMNFGKEFVKLYQKHPNVGHVGICRRNLEALRKTGKELGIKENMQFESFEAVCASKEIDAIHIVTPILDHYSQSLASLNAGKHTACTVPMATTVEELKTLVEAQKESGKIYMMMETSVYTREYLYVKHLVESGKLGRIQMVRGSHMQDMGLEGWPEYWKGFPPFWYGTHAIAPLLMINNTEAVSVVGHGSGHIDEDLQRRYNSPFAVETLTFKLKDTDVVAEATRSLYETVRQYRESFDVYGSKMSYEWAQIEDEGAVIFEGGETAKRFNPPDTDDLLIEELKPFTKRETISNKENVSFIQGAGHGGSHPHLVQEFISSIAEDRQPSLNAKVSANITAAGLCGHESCLKDGARIEIPEF